MSQPPDQFAEHLLPEESLRGVYGATLSGAADRRSVSVGVTDRRLLCLSADGAVLSVGHDSISTVRAVPRRYRTVRGLDYRVVIGAGSFLTVAGALGAAAVSVGVAGAVAALLAVAAVATAAAFGAERSGAEFAAVAAVRRLAADRAETDDPIERYRRRAAAALEDGYERHVPEGKRTAVERRLPALLVDEAWLVAAAGLAAACVLAALALASSALLAALALCVTLSGLALIEYALSNRAALDGTETVRRREREVRIRTEDGQSVAIRSDPADGIDRELTRAAFVGDEDYAATLSARP